MQKSIVRDALLDMRPEVWGWMRYDGHGGLHSRGGAASNVAHPFLRLMFLLLLLLPARQPLS